MTKILLIPNRFRKHFSARQPAINRRQLQEDIRRFQGEREEIQQKLRALASSQTLSLTQQQGKVRLSSIRKRLEKSIDQLQRKLAASAVPIAPHQSSRWCRVVTVPPERHHMLYPVLNNGVNDGAIADGASASVDIVVSVHSTVPAIPAGSENPADGFFVLVTPDAQEPAQQFCSDHYSTVRILTLDSNLELALLAHKVLQGVITTFEIPLDDKQQNNIKPFDIAQTHYAGRLNSPPANTCDRRHPRRLISAPWSSHYPNAGDAPVDFSGRVLHGEFPFYHDLLEEILQHQPFRSIAKSQLLRAKLITKDPTDDTNSQTIDSWVYTFAVKFIKKIYRNADRWIEGALETASQLPGPAAAGTTGLLDPMYNKTFAFGLQAEISPKRKNFRELRSAAKKLQQAVQQIFTTASADSIELIDRAEDFRRQSAQIADYCHLRNLLIRHAAGCLQIPDRDNSVPGKMKSRFAPGSPRRVRRANLVIKAVDTAIESDSEDVSKLLAELTKINQQTLHGQDDSIEDSLYRNRHMLEFLSSDSGYLHPGRHTTNPQASLANALTQARSSYNNLPREELSHFDETMSRRHLLENAEKDFRKLLEEATQDRLYLVANSDDYWDKTPQERQQVLRHFISAILIFLRQDSHADKAQKNFEDYWRLFSECSASATSNSDWLRDAAEELFALEDFQQRQFVPRGREISSDFADMDPEDHRNADPPLD